MNSIDLRFRVRELSDEIKMMRSELETIKQQAYDELWDNSDMIRNWGISKRTLASWRSKGLIDYVQLGSKIWYTKESREAFITNYSNKQLLPQISLN